MAITHAQLEGMYPDGAGLYLQVGPNGNKSWIFRFTLNGRPREMGLGPLHVVNLAAARAKADECRRLKLEGIDPIEARRASRAQAKLEAAKSITFKQCAKAYIDGHRSGWRNAKHADQWTNTLKSYADPVFGSLAVSAIDTKLVLKAIEPIWMTKTETASRLRGRIEAILAWAAVHEYRSGENPARWRGHIDKLLPEPSRVRRIKHHSALPYDEMAEFITHMRAQEGVGGRALEFLILTAARTGEVLHARWDEIDLANRLWKIPGERMKNRKPHRVPLSQPAIAILECLDTREAGKIVFQKPGLDKPFSDNALLAVLRRMNRSDLTAHGFRSTFRDWAADCTDYPEAVVEMALAHTVSDKVLAAYRRTDLFARRKHLMDDWAQFCKATDDVQTVITLQAK